MPSSPLEGLWQAAAQAALRLELASAASVEAHAAGMYVMSALAGMMVGMGTDAFTLLRSGLPPYLPNLLLGLFGTWDTTLWGIALTAAALPVTAWALRAWWAANMQLLAHAQGPLQALLRQAQQQLQRVVAPGEGGSSISSGGGGSSGLGQQAAGSSHWLAATAIAFRGLCLAAVVSSVTGLLASSSTSSITGANPALTAAVQGLAAVAAAAAAAGLLLLHQLQPSQSGSSTDGPQRRLLVPLLAAEAAWVVASVGLHPLLNVAAAVALAACLVQLHSAAVAPRLLQFKAAPGDGVHVHVGLTLGGTRSVFDSTLADAPLQLTAGPLPPGFAALWERASDGQLCVDADAGGEEYTGHAAAPQQQQQQQQQAVAEPSSSAGGSGGSPAPGLRDVQQQLQGWLHEPSARWDVLTPFIADAAQGLYLGETRVVPLFNPRGVGYWNPSFSWWQPAADVAAKFAGQAPSLGDVFWYPVADGAAVPTRVTAVSEDYVELDANYGVTEAPLELRVQLVRLQKPQPLM